MSTPSFAPLPSGKPELTPPAPQRRRCIIIGAVIAGLALIFCAVAGGIAFVAWRTASQEMAPITATVTDFLRAGEQRDIDAATALISETPARALRATELAILFDEQASLFEDVSDVQISSISVSAETGRPTTTDISGTIQYGDETTRPFSATLVKIADVYYLQDFAFE